jgi:hypothetical protein
MLWLILLRKCGVRELSLEKEGSTVKKSLKTAVLKNTTTVYNMHSDVTPGLIIGYVLRCSNITLSHYYSVTVFPETEIAHPRQCPPTTASNFKPMLRMLM